MNKNIIKEIILHKQKEIMQTTIVERPMNFESALNYILVGIRRAGKSYMMFQAIQQRVATGEMSIEDCLYLNFEDERLDGMQAAELAIIIDCYHELFGHRKPWMYLDEIQNIEGWEKFARRLADEKYHLMITGSNAKMLSREMATTLGGRFIIREVFPFSWRDFLAYQNIALTDNWQYDSQVRLDVVRSFDDYFYNGGFAEVFPILGKREYLNGLYQKILMGDIVARHGIRNDRAIRLLARKVADGVMQPTALSRFQHIVKSSGESISLPTVKDYLQYMEDNYLIFSIPNFVSPFSEQETIKKRYLMDNGLLNIFLYQGETKLLENLCAIHLLKQYSNLDEPRLFYYNKNVEVDFYVPSAGYAVQVSYDVNDPDTFRRETSALVALHRAFGLQRAVIVTRDHEETFECDDLTIEAIPIWKWLLE